MGLSELDIKLLQLIELAPTMSVRELAEKAGTSWITAKKHLQHLKDIGVLSAPIAVFNPTSLGLNRYIVFFLASDLRQIERLEKACDIHPYTHYRSRIYGPYPGIFAQFDIPASAVANLKEFLSKLKEIDICDNVVVEPSSGHRTTTVTNLDHYQPDTMSWQYDWTSWSKEITSSPNELPDIEPNHLGRVSEFSMIDLKILRDLTSNAKISQKNLREKYSISQSSTSRKVIDIMKNHIESVRAQIDRSQFDIVSTKLFYCDEADNVNRNKLFNAFSFKSAPPFPLSVDLLKSGGVILWGRMPPSHEHHLFYSLWHLLPRLQVFTMDTVGGHSCLYWFYPENYNESKNNWKTGRQWVVDTPFEELQAHSR